MNPKDVVGKTKPPIGLIPGAALVECALVAAIGNEEYGPFNWRTQPIEVMEYVNAVLRHALAFVDGETLDQKSGRPHFAHIMQTAAIILDAAHCGTLIDNRPAPGPAGEAIRAASRIPSSPDDSRPVVDLGTGQAGEPGRPVVGRHGLGQQNDSDR